MPANVEQQVKHLESLGVTFNLMSRDEAEAFLTERTYFFKLKGYLANYRKGGREVVGPAEVDFAHLVELSLIDFSLSRVCLTMALAVEHSIKIRLNKLMMKHCGSADIRSMAVEFFTSYDIKVRPNPYTHHLVTEEKAVYLPWELWELMSFSDQLQMYKSISIALGEDVKDVPLLHIVQKLRNAVSHGNCLLADVTLQAPALSKGSRNDYRVSKKALWMCDIPRKPTSRSQSFRNDLNRLVVNNFAALLYCFFEYVSSRGMHQHAVDELQALIRRINRNIGRYYGVQANVEGCSNRSAPRNKEVNSTLKSIIRLAEGFISKSEKRYSASVASLENGLERLA